MANFYQIVTSEGTELCFTKGGFNASLREYKEQGVEVLSVKTLYPVPGVEIVPPPIDGFEDFI